MENDVCQEVQSGVSSSDLVDQMGVYQTKDYHIFKFFKGNRRVDQKHVGELVRAMQQEDLHYLDPIMVTKDYHIVDGQHRFMARVKLDRPVFYMVSPVNVTVEQINKLNSHVKNWKMSDVLDSHCAKGIREYILIKEFIMVHRLSLLCSLYLLSGTTSDGGGSDGFRHDFIEGVFKIKNLNLANEWAKRIKDIGRFYECFERRSFVIACIKMFKNEQYDHKKMMDKISYQSTKIVHCVDTSSYLQLLEGIYNNKQTSDTKVRFY